jgi:hypothetical protein
VSTARLNIQSISETYGPFGPESWVVTASVHTKDERVLSATFKAPAGPGGEAELEVQGRNSEALPDGMLESVEQLCAAALAEIWQKRREATNHAIEEATGSWHEISF